MEELINLGIYFAICVGIFGVVFGGVYLKKKFNIKDSEIELSKLIVQLVVHLAKKGEFKFSGDIETVAKYVIIAFDIVEEYEQTFTIEEKKDLIASEAMDICEDNGIVVDVETIELISNIIDYFI